MDPRSLQRAAQLLQDEVLQQLAVVQWCASELEKRGPYQEETAHALRLMREAATAAMASARQALDELRSQPHSQG